MPAPPIQLVYASVATKPFSDARVNALLRHARQANRSSDIGGCLLYENGSFLQFLEGPGPAVEALYERIAQDSRHTDVTLLQTQTVTERRFGDWKMGFFPDARVHVETLDGFGDFFAPGGGFTRLTSQDERLGPLLEALRSGEWHAHLR